MCMRFFLKNWKIPLWYAFFPEKLENSFVRYRKNTQRKNTQRNFGPLRGAGKMTEITKLCVITEKKVYSCKLFGEFFPGFPGCLVTETRRKKFEFVCFFLSWYSSVPSKGRELTKGVTLLTGGGYFDGLLAHAIEGGIWPILASNFIRGPRVLEGGGDY